MTDNTLISEVITASDGTKAVIKVHTMTTPQGVKQVQSSQPQTADQINAQITALQADLALLA